MKYTVLLQYPEYLTDGELQTYAAHTHAEDPEEAVGAARDQVRMDNTLTLSEAADFHVLYVSAGHHDDLTPEPEA